jgi:hypothetical protein
MILLIVGWLDWAVLRARFWILAFGRADLNHHATGAGMSEWQNKRRNWLCRY